MGNVYVTIKLMPESLNVNLDDIKRQAEEVVTKFDGRMMNTKEEPIAFGLKALIIQFAISESQELEPLEEELQTKEGVNSVSIVEMNRAL